MFKKSPEAKKFFDNAYGFAVFPALGGRAFSEIIFFQDKRAYNEFISGAFEFDVKASAVTITVGVQRKPAPPVKLPAQALGRQPADRLRQSTLKGWQY